MKNLSPTSGRYCLQVADQLFYACDDIEENGTPEQAQELKRKFERAFGNAWERIPRRDRMAILTYWEAAMPSRSVLPFLSPHIELDNDWASFGPEHEMVFWQIGQAGTELLFWAQAIDAMPEQTVVSLIIEGLAFVSIYARAYKWGTKVGDVRRRAVRAYCIRVCEWRHGGTALENWKKSKDGKRFCSEWKRWFELFGLNFDIEEE